ncbi:MAG: hypothetical protein ACD_87C00077G0003 [uncultured bacterium]|nr:MAG: hypothetical protein ACD_87C00077G0003 [uncultured bacterium]
MAFRIVAEGEGGVLDPVIELFHIPLGEFQRRVDLPDLFYSHGGASEFGEHRIAFPVKGIVTRLRIIDEFLDVGEYFLLIEKRRVFARQDIRLRDLTDLKTEEVLALRPCSPQLLKPVVFLVELTVPVIRLAVRRPKREQSAELVENIRVIVRV